MNDINITSFAMLMLMSLGSVAQQLPNTDVNQNNNGIVLIRNQLGAGTPAPNITIGLNVAEYINDGYYHTPQYMPNYPTAAIIWPRVIEVQCSKLTGEVICDGYHWLPSLGRGEYLFVIPTIRQPATPIPVYVEVPVKKKNQ